MADKNPFDNLAEGTAATIIALGRAFLDELAEIRKKPYSEEERAGFWKKVRATALEIGESKKAKH